MNVVLDQDENRDENIVFESENGESDEEDYDSDDITYLERELDELYEVFFLTNLLLKLFQ